jgi:hypothetical protein
MKKRCAYCNEEKPLTREHIWPKCFLEKRENVTAHFSVKGQKVHGSDYVVKDVCSDCNNIILSKLDSYFCELYDEYFHKIVDNDEQILFDYDFNLLSRALLKIAYNTSRGGVSDPSILAKTAPYIIGRKDTYKELIIILEIVSPTGLMGIGKNGINYNIIPPLGYRSALTRLTTPNGHKVLSRLVGVNSYYFHLFIPNCSLTQEELNIIEGEALETLKEAVSLNDKSQITIKMCDRDGLSTMIPRIVNHFDDYKKYFDSKSIKNN